MAHVPTLEKSPYCQIKELDREPILGVSSPKEIVYAAVFQKGSIMRTREIVTLQKNKIIYLKSAKQPDITIKGKGRQF